MSPSPLWKTFEIDFSLLSDILCHVSVRQKYQLGPTIHSHFLVCAFFAINSVYIWSIPNKVYITMNRKIIPIEINCLQTSRSPLWKVRTYCTCDLFFVYTDDDCFVFWCSNCCALWCHMRGLCCVCDVTDTKSRDELSLHWSAQNTTHSSLLQTKDKYHVQNGRTFHRRDLEICK